jgi:hypothetical protein
LSLRFGVETGVLLQRRLFLPHKGPQDDEGYRRRAADVEHKESRDQLRASARRCGAIVVATLGAIVLLIVYRLIAGRAGVGT